MNDAADLRALARTSQEHTFRTHDGVDLFYRHWPSPEGRGPRGRCRRAPSLRTRRHSAQGAAESYRGRKEFRKRAAR